MMLKTSTQELQLCEFLKNLPHVFKNRYTEQAENELLQALFWSLAGGRPEYLRLFFPDNTRPLPNATWKLRKAQGGADGDEFTEAARGKACGHIFKSGEATYRCKTCSADDTCVLCSRCYDSSDHTGHMVYVSVSMGNSGCCDCGDPEAWKLPVHCSIHTSHEKAAGQGGKGKAAALPEELIESIRMTVGRVFDYICDIISCSPEQLRLPKTRETILEDEKMSRLTSKYYNGDIIEDPCEFALLLWNDEKHTVDEVRDQVARACKVTMAEGLKRAHETDDVGRSIIKYSTNIDDLLRVSSIIEQIKVTVTIRSARDTFREQMCGTVIEWMNDIAGCSVGPDHDILRRVVCEEMLKGWSTGSEATNREIGVKGIDDHEWDDQRAYRNAIQMRNAERLRRAVLAAAAAAASDDEADSGNEDLVTAVELEIEVEQGDGDSGSDISNSIVAAERIHIELGPPLSPLVFTQDIESDEIRRTSEVDEQRPAGPSNTDGEGDTQMTEADEDLAMEAQEATMAGYPPPPPPPAPPLRQVQDRDLTPSDSDTAEPQPLISSRVYAKANMKIPKTPKHVVSHKQTTKPARYWLETSDTFSQKGAVPLHEDLWERLRLDWMILFDLRMWKKVRVGLRDLYIATVVAIPEFKRILGLRFAGLYTTLAQLYLIADREPDHSIINISLQMLTTPSITSEIVERGNFLTNLMAILYTFLTTRQVGHPYEVLPNAVLAFESGSVTNRRMYHFFMDLRYLFGSEHVQECLRSSDRYIIQFLDLVKLHQGICPNVRAVGEHVEYETDAWISASLITREINRLCRQFSESFKWNTGEDSTYIFKAIRLAAKTVILNSLGTERKRFTQAEIKDEIKFKKVGDYEFDTTEMPNSVLQHSVVKFVVESQPISFHHALHYTLSWLIECGKSMQIEQLRELLTFTTEELLQKPRAMGQRTMPTQDYTSEDHLMAAFDYPLRVCAWLAQMKASMWVRNGMSLRHQQGTYRGVSQRDVSHHRDIFLLQTAMVVCPPARVLVSMIDRYGLDKWMKGLYEYKSDGLEDGQVLDVAEDLIHLLIVLISDRTSLISKEEEPNPHVLAMRRDITHVLCFKPLSFSEICTKLPDKFQDQEECQDILDDMTNFKPPEGLSDTGTFELKEQFLEDIDPYIAHYNKNQREESENAYKSWMSKNTGKAAADIVFESKLRSISTGVFADLSAFTRTGIFAQIIYYSLLYPLKAEQYTSTVPLTRIEVFLQVVLHLVLIAIAEDKTEEDEMSEESLQSFVYTALTRNARSNFMPNAASSRTIAAVLEMLSQKEAFKSCHLKIELVLKRMKQKRPHNFETAYQRLGVPVDRVSTASPAIDTTIQEREKKKQAALARQAKVMAQFQQQQKSFLDNQGDIDWGEDEMSDENLEEENDQKNYIQYPSGTCILCQEDTGDGRLFGTFSLMMNSSILRQTDFRDPCFIREVTATPASLDQSAEMIRPFGVSGENRQEIHKVNSNGLDILSERSFIGKGFPSKAVRSGPVSVGCGHIMHYKCFEDYCESSNRRHQHQIARHHPENIELKEFVCPLCKALGNAFLPVIWAPKEAVYPGPLRPVKDFSQWIESTSVLDKGMNQRSRKITQVADGSGSRLMSVFMENKNSVVNSLASKMSELLIDAWEQTSPTAPPPFTPNSAFRVNVLIGSPITGETTIWSGNGSASRDQTAGNSVSPMKELVDVYRRLRDTMLKNELPSRYLKARTMNIDDNPNDLSASDTLAQSLGYSISAVEIQQRGNGAPFGTTILETIPQQAVTHLCVLAETALSYISLGGIKRAGDNQVASEFCETYERQHYQLYLTDAYLGGVNSNQSPPPSLLDEDIFIFLTESSLCLALVDEVEIMHLVRLCYLAEIVKAVLLIGRNTAHSLVDESISGTTVDKFRTFCHGVWVIDDQGDSVQKSDSYSQAGAPNARDFVQKYALAFLRKVVILLHVRYGVAFHNHVCSDPSATELERLTEALKLPSFNDMCSYGPFLTHSGYSAIVNSLVYGWIRTSKENYTHEGSLSLAHPAIFELIGLPKKYDTLMEETMKRRCPTTGKDVSDPMLCLFCGDIFCGQSICCLKEGPERPGKRPQQIGGAQQHMLNCQKNIGLFINIRKCCVFYLYHESGSWTVAPYIDKYGEVDPGLRHSRQLFLNQKRYDALLRTVWLGHGAPSVISRKLEMDINNGGWETI